MLFHWSRHSVVLHKISGVRRWYTRVGHKAGLKGHSHMAISPVWLKDASRFVCSILTCMLLSFVDLKILRLSKLNKLVKITVSRMLTKAPPSKPLLLRSKSLKLCQMLRTMTEICNRETAYQRKQIDQVAACMGCLARMETCGLRQP